MRAGALRRRFRRGEDIVEPTPEPQAAQATEPVPEQPAAAPKTAKSVVIDWARRLMVVLVLVGAGYTLVKQWPEVSHTLLSLPWPVVVLSFVAVFIGIWLGPIVWQVLLSDLGAPVRIRDACKIYLVGQLGKYVPGSVWAFLLQMELAKTVGVNRARSFTASLLAAGIAVVASLITGVLALPAFFSGNHELLWLFVLLPIGLMFLHPKLLTWLVNKVLRVLRRAPLDAPLGGWAIAKATLLAVLLYAVYGVHMYLLVETLGYPGGQSFVLCIGAMGLAMTAGLIAFFLPSGIGARELVIVTALTTVMPYGQALALALVSRLMFTVADLASAGAAALFAQLSRKAPLPVPDAVPSP
jgi:glycosyltransferase 2 family protein